MSTEHLVTYMMRFINANSFLKCFKCPGKKQLLLCFACMMMVSYRSYYTTVKGIIKMRVSGGGLAYYGVTFKWNTAFQKEKEDLESKGEGGLA